jgi:hypothetical protein
MLSQVPRIDLPFMVGMDPVIAMLSRGFLGLGSYRFNELKIELQNLIGYSWFPRDVSSGLAASWPHNPPILRRCDESR